MKGSIAAKASTNERTMHTGARGCSRCGGWVIEFIDFIFSEERAQRYLRCLICGERQYLENQPGTARRRSKPRGVDLDADPRLGVGGEEVAYARSPVGKRLVRCGCNDEFIRDDPKTECFDDMTRCRRCGHFPWYRIEATQGGSNLKRAGQQDVSMTAQTAQS